MPFYERGPIRIYYEEVGSGFPLLIIPGGGLNSTLASLQSMSPFNPMERYKDDFRCISADLRNAASGQFGGPLEIDRPWDAYADDHLGLMDRTGNGYPDFGTAGGQGPLAIPAWATCVDSNRFANQERLERTCTQSATIRTW